MRSDGARLDCARARRLVPSFPSGDLADADDRALRRHLAGCPACRRELRVAMEIRAAFEATTGPQVAPAEIGGPRLDQPDVADRFFAELRADVLRRVAAESMPRIVRVGGVRRAVAAAAVFVLGIGGAWLLAGEVHRPHLLESPRLEFSAADDPGHVPMAGTPGGLSDMSAPVSFADEPTPLQGLEGMRRTDSMIEEIEGELDPILVFELAALREVPGRGQDRRR